jgi:hypothetical protein
VNGTGGLIGPAAAALLIDSGASTQKITIGGTSANAVDISRAGILTRLLGNATVAGTLGVTSDFSVNTSKFTVTASTGATAFAGDLAINGTSFTVASATGNTVMAGSLTGSNASGFLVDSSATQPLKLGTASTTTSVTISRSGQTTTVAGLLTVSGNATFNGTTTFNGTGTAGIGSAITLLEIGTCTETTGANPFVCDGSAGHAVFGITLTNLNAANDWLFVNFVSAGSIKGPCEVDAITTNTSFTIRCAATPAGPAVMNILRVRK